MRDPSKPDPEELIELNRSIGRADDAVPGTIFFMVTTLAGLVIFGLIAVASNVDWTSLWSAICGGTCAQIDGRGWVRIAEGL